MATFTELVAAVVVHSSAAAYSHFGVVLEPAQLERPQPVSERVVVRTPRKPVKAVNRCPESGRERLLST
jgi:hypothetical protein